jgi:hypothetical protein
MANNPNGNTNSSQQMKDDLLGARNYANEMASEMKKVSGGSEKALTLISQIKDQMKFSVDFSDKLNILQQERDEYLRQEILAGRSVNENLLNQIENQIQIMQKVVEVDELKQKQIENEEIHNDLLKEANDKLYGGLGILGEWLKAGTSIELASQALNGTIDMIGASFDNTLGTVVSLNRELGIARSTSVEITGQATMAGLSFDGLRFSTDELVGATHAYVETLGTAGGLSQGLIRNIADLTKLTGDAEGAVALSTIFEHANHDSAALTENIKQLAEKEGIASSKIFKDLVRSSNLLVGASEEQIENFAKQNIELQKQGLSMESLESISGNMLDIESSMRAQAKARALLNDTITDSQFQSMNAVRQQALAYESGAMNIEEFGNAIQNSIISQKEFNELGPTGQRIYADAIGMSINQLEEIYHITEAVRHQHDPSWWSKAASGIAAVWESTPGFLKSATSALGGYLAQMTLLSALDKGSLSGGIRNVGATLIGRGSSGGTSPAMPDSSGASKGMGGLTKSISKINTSALLKGAAAMVVVAAAVFVFGKAVQEFTEVEWSDVGKAVVSMFSLVGAVGALGLIMSSGVGTVAILAGAAAMLVIAGSVWVLGKALNNMIPFFESFGGIISNMNMDTLLPLTLLGPALFGIAAGLMAIGSAGIISIPGILAITALAAAAPILSKLADSMGMGDDDETDSSTEKETIIQTENKELLKQIIGLRNDIQMQPIIVTVDGKVVSKISKVQSRQGVNERSFK